MNLTPKVPLAEERPSNAFLRAFARGISVIRAFDRDHPEMTLTQVAAITHLTRANARRILLTLETLGYVRQRARLFSLRPRVLDLGYAFLSSLDLTFHAQPVMDDFVERHHVPCNLAMLDGEHIIYVLRSSIHDLKHDFPINIGHRFPAVVTPMGRILLGALPEPELDAFLAGASLTSFTPDTILDRADLKRRIMEDAAQGWSYIAREQAAWITSLGVPIADRQGAARAALGVGWSANPATDARSRDEILPSLLAAAREIATSLSRVR